MLLMWLVVPAEAAGVAQAAGGVVAAAAAATAAASAILNYWAAMEGDTAGDLEVLNKGCGVIRIMSSNLRRVKRDETDDASSGRCCSGHLGRTGYRGGGRWCTWAGSTVECWEAEG